MRLDLEKLIKYLEKLDKDIEKLSAQRESFKNLLIDAQLEQAFGPSTENN